MVKKIHLTLPDIQSKIRKLQAEKETEQFHNNKTKRRRIFQQLAKLQKALHNPENLTVDPNILTQQRQKDQQRRIGKKLSRKEQGQSYLKNKKRHQKRCIKCGSRQHLLGDCPQTKGGFCYKCGSHDHLHTECEKEEYALADCFHCGEKGHIARECPKNERGLYRKGGCCFGCGSVRHILRDCPVRHNNAGKGAGAGTFQNDQEF